MKPLLHKITYMEKENSHLRSEIEILKKRTQKADETIAKIMEEENKETIQMEIAQLM